MTALGLNSETKGLADAFRPSFEALALAKAAREQAEEGLIAPRAAARFAEAGLEVVVRDIAAQAHASDRQAGGDLVFKAIFPNGLDAEVRPRGAAQLTAATALRGRLDKQPAAAPVKRASAVSPTARAAPPAPFGKLPWYGCAAATPLRACFRPQPRGTAWAGRDPHLRRAESPPALYSGSGGFLPGDGLQPLPQVASRMVASFWFTQPSRFRSARTASAAGGMARESHTSLLVMK